jgi:hypothetical protein
VRGVGGALVPKGGVRMRQGEQAVDVEVKDFLQVVGSFACGVSMLCTSSWENRLFSMSDDDPLTVDLMESSAFSKSTSCGTGNCLFNQPSSTSHCALSVGWLACAQVTEQRSRDQPVGSSHRCEADAYRTVL